MRRASSLGRRCDSGHAPARRSRRERARRPVRAHGADRDDPGAAGTRAALRDLPGPPAARACARAGHFQAAFRPPGRQPSGPRSAQRACSRHLPESRLRGRARRRRRGEPHLAERRDGRGLLGPGLLDGPVPPRGRARAVGRPALLRRDRRHVPKRTDLRSLLIVGSGPIRIGQACEFDYSGAQACRVLRREGYRVVLVNSNPATIMTDPEWADATYLEPLDAETLAELIAVERPDALLPTLGGQTALNLAVALAENGVLAEHGVELIGADLDAIRTAEDRSLFRAAMESAGLPVAESCVVTSLDELPAGFAPAVV